MKSINTLGLAFALAVTSHAYADVEPLDRIAAIVNNDVVMESQLLERTETIKAQIRSRNSQMPPAKVLEEQVIERLISESIQMQLAERGGVRIDDQELNETITNIAQRNNMQLEEFKQAIEADGLSYAQAREQIRRDMIMNRVRQGRVAQRISVSDQEVANFEQSEEGQAQLAADYHLAHILVPLPDAASPEQIDAAKLRAGLVFQQLQNGADFESVAMAESAGQNALEGGDLGWRKTSQLPSLFSSIATKMKAGETAEPIRSASGFHIIKLVEKRGGVNLIQAQLHVRHILIKPTEIRSSADAKAKAVQLLERIRGGEDFASLARAHSDDPGSALSGGDMNWINPHDLVPEFREVMHNSPLNVISEPFMTQFGWHILEVLGKRDEDLSEQAKANQIRNFLRARKFEEEVQIWLREIRSDAFVDIKNLN